MMGYAYSIGQMNTTLGFLPFSLTQIRKPVQLYTRFFGLDQAKDAESLWGTGMGFLARLSVWSYRADCHDAQGTGEIHPTG